jgi:putative flippase GtrA
MLKKIFKDKTDNTFIQLFRSVLSGAIAFAVDFSALYILTEFFGIYYLVSAIFAFILGVTTIYILSITFVFSKRSVENRWFEFAIFVFIGIVGLASNQFFLWYFTERVHLYYLYSKVVATAIVFLWNFFSRKIILFRKSALKHAH